MQKVRSIFIALAIMMSTNAVLAQSLDDAKKLFYYERYNSAQNALSSIVSSNPNNIEAVYWLGQTMMEKNDIAGARSLYQKTLMQNPNAALILVGMGQVELMENKASDARNRFETAISLTKGKDVNVLSAIGRANTVTKNGDLAYAVEKLKQAAESNKKTAEILTNLGDAYRKLNDGSNAQMAYQNALALDPNYARASFMMGRIYQTQGYAQEPIYMRYYMDAISKDPKYAPVYGWLSEYYYYRDINKAREYLDKYIANADANSKNCFYQAAYVYASGNNQGAISKADECIAAAGNDVYPNLYGIKAYAYDKMGDSLNAKKFFETYFQKQAPDQIGPNDYLTYGKILMKFKGNEAQAASYIERAINADTVVANKVNTLTSLATSFAAAKNYNEAGDWYKRILYIKPNPGKLDLYNAGYNYYMGGNYKGADSIFSLYCSKYPTELLGCYMAARSEAYIDSTGALGLAKANYEKVIAIADTATNKADMKSAQIAAYNYMVAYYYNTKNDRATALSFVDKILAIDPTNQNALKTKEALSKPVKEKVKEDKTKVKTETSKTKVVPGKAKVKKK
jgi:tetratricopeptide (TPR) repeat protein